MELPVRGSAQWVFKVSGFTKGVVFLIFPWRGGVISGMLGKILEIGKICKIKSMAKLDNLRKTNKLKKRIFSFHNLQTGLLEWCRELGVFPWVLLFTGF